MDNVGGLILGGGYMFCLSKLNRNNTCLPNAIHHLPLYRLFFFPERRINKRVLHLISKIAPARVFALRFVLTLQALYNNALEGG